MGQCGGSGRLKRLAGRSRIQVNRLDDAVASLWLVEWPQRAGPALPAADLRVELDMSGAGRSACLHALSDTGRAWLAQLSTRGDLAPLAVQPV
jgi:tRNA threonylcarbamoyladenosine biosynthesis protein TsaE